jgi:hypothetical protein
VCCPKGGGEVLHSRAMHCCLLQACSRLLTSHRDCSVLWHSVMNSPSFYDQATDEDTRRLRGAGDFVPLTRRRRWRARG